jgi:hypothetical protein
MSQFLGACSCLRQHLVAEREQVPGDARRRIDQERQQVDLSVPKVVPFVGLAGEAFRRHAGAFRARRGLQDVKKVEADRLLDLDGAALDSVFPDVLDADIAAAPEIIHVLLLSREQSLESLAHYPIQSPFGTAAKLLGGSRLRGVIDHVLGELDWTAGLRLDGEGDLAEVGTVDDLV